jgi:hypothetical protein
MLNTTCQFCNKDCRIWEEVETGYGGPVEIWCYCEECKLETFQASPWYKNDDDE